MDEPLGPSKEAERVALAQLARNSAFELILTVILPITHRTMLVTPNSRITVRISSNALLRASWANATRSASLGGPRGSSIVSSFVPDHGDWPLRPVPE